VRTTPAAGLFSAAASALDFAEPAAAQIAPIVSDGQPNGLQRYASSTLSLNLAEQIALNPQPLPPDKSFELNPQPLPPDKSFALNPQPLPPDRVDMVALNPQPLPPAESIALNPQPLPPAESIALNPQPLPPDRVNRFVPTRLYRPTASVALNPQPLPPLEINHTSLLLIARTGLDLSNERPK
jgi:hypothetical protein